LAESRVAYDKKRHDVKFTQTEQESLLDRLDQEFIGETQGGLAEAVENVRQWADEWENNIRRVITDATTLKDRLVELEQAKQTNLNEIRKKAMRTSAKLYEDRLEKRLSFERKMVLAIAKLIGGEDLAKRKELEFQRQDELKENREQFMNERALADERERLRRTMRAAWLWLAPTWSRNICKSNMRLTGPPLRTTTPTSKSWQRPTL